MSALEPPFLENATIMKNKLKTGFIGGGNMAAALIGGMAGRVSAASDIHVVDINRDTLDELEKKFGVTTSTDIDAALAACDVLVLAVKPQQIRDVMQNLLPHIRRQLILSVAAGIRTTDISRWTNGYPAIVRTMPNTPALIGQGITGLFAMPGVTDEQKNAADAIMKAVGETLWVEKESLLDTVTAISGSGPAYVFYFIEALRDAGVQLGLDGGQAARLAIATFRGAGELAAQSTEPAELLRERVTSPGGTTFAAISSMESDNLKARIIKAAKAAAARSVELGDESGRD